MQASAWKAAIVQELLAQSSEGPFVVEWLRSCAAGLERLNDPMKNASTAVLVDLSVPDGQGLETVDVIFQASPHVPIMVLSHPEHEEVAKQAVQRGAQDYILDDRLDNHSLSKALRNMIERAASAEDFLVEKERAQVILNSIGDAVISTDAAGSVTYLNQVAETMTGWTGAEALGRAVGEVLQIIDGANPEHTVNPMAVAMKENKTVGLTVGAMRVRRDRSESAIEDSAAPIHNRRGQVTGAVMVFNDVTQLRAMSNRLSYFAHHDYLTELPNRLLLNDRLTQAMAAARRQQQQLAVLFVDVDRFKHINDSLGHAIGDQLLLSVAGRLVASVRSSDTVSRQGGDEFVVLLSTIAQAEDADLDAIAGFYLNPLLHCMLVGRR